MRDPATSPGGPSTGQAAIVLLALLFLLALINARWLECDFIDPIWDEASYLLNSRHAFETLRDKGPLALGELYYQDLGVRPTFFFVLLALPFYFAFGTSADVAILGTNTLVYAVLLWATFLLGRHWFGARAGLMAACVTALIPGVSALSRLYWPHFTVVAAAPLGTYLLLRSAGFTRLLPALGFGLLLGASLMARPVYPALFLLAPALWVTAEALLAGVLTSGSNSTRRRIDWNRLWRNVVTRLFGRALPALMAALVVAGPFYYHKLSATFSFVALIQAANVAGTSARPLWYLTQLPSELSPFLCLLLAIGLTAGLVRHRSAVLQPAFCLAISFAVISIPTFKRTYYLPPLFPLVGILATYWIWELRHRGLRRGLAVLTLLLSAAAFWITAWGPPDRAEPLTKRIFPIAQPHYRVVNRLDWKIPQVVDLIFAECHAREDTRVGLVGWDLMMSTRTFLYLAPRAEALSFVDRLVALEALVGAQCVAVERYAEGRQPGFSREGFPRWRADHNLAAWMLADEASAFYRSHRLLGRVTLADGRSLQVYSRASPASEDETRRLAAELIAVDPQGAESQIWRFRDGLQGSHPELEEALLEILYELPEKRAAEGG